MRSDAVFKIVYWGITGTIADPLIPRQVTDKIAETVRLLLDGGHLAELAAEPVTDEKIRAVLARVAPFHLRSSYGGNTTCVEVQTRDRLIVFDCGTGFRELGISLEERWAKEGAAADRSAHVLLTHAHMDHTLSTPFFGPYFNPANSFRVSGPKVAIDSLEAVLDPKSALSRIYFPPTYDEMEALSDFRRIEPGAEFMIGATRVTTHALNHPGGSLAYRLDCEGRSMVFATDHEHLETPDRGLAEFARGADLLYTEGQYSREEYDGRAGIAGDAPVNRHGWGHSPVESCVATALAAGVKRLHVGHRDPRRNDHRVAKFDEFVHGCMRAELARQNLAADACEALVPYEALEVSI